MNDLGRTLLVVGLALAAIGALLVLVGKAGLPIGRLPGDFSWKGKGWAVYFPIATSIVVSILLTILARLFFRNR